MIISHNLLAMNANRQFNIINKNKAKSTEKLSSGYRINRASDDAAGLSISEKMRWQIRGLNQGVRNTQDGVSVCQVADGALAEVGEMLHRITELSVQSANDTNTDEDRRAIQQEIGQIIQEIDRIGETTTFNERKVFSPTFDKTGIVNGGNINNGSGNIKTKYKIYMDIGGHTTDSRAASYILNAQTDGISVNSGELIQWSQFSTSGGNSLNIDNIQTGKYKVKLHGMDISLSLDGTMSKDDLINEIHDIRFSTTEIANTYKTTGINSITFLSDKYIQIGSEDTYIIANEKGIGISLNGGDHLSNYMSWDAMGIDVNNVTAGTYTYTDTVETGLSFSFEIDSSVTNIDDVMKSLNKVTVNNKVLVSGEQYNGAYAGTSATSIQDMKCSITPYSPSYKGDEAFRTYISSADKTWLKGINASSGAWFVGKYDNDTISFTYSGQSNTSYIAANNGVTFKMTADSYNALKNYNYNLNSKDNPLMLRFETDKGSYMYFNLENDGTGNFQNAISEFTNWQTTHSLADKYMIGLKPTIEYFTLSPYDTDPNIFDKTEYQVFMYNNTVLLDKTVSDIDTPGDVDISDKERGIWIQSGSQEGQGMFLEIDRMDTKILGINNLDVSTADGANHAIDAVQDALNKISSSRSKIGAQQNRLEHTISNNQNNSENTSSAESRIRDTDMADEMVKFSKESILENVGQAMLAQSNQFSQNVLSLLQ